eukprot:CAMPEP_0172802874 /NCGR_PEP_ID=MMETSP1075-20121228/4139_1 /TAXON_ID=2916 /ORGANISM="Ceratium fusus, Strain PA161109" /LENGTH=91 /DNA_ID=CAMNT_0013641199 /DNA_START=594 /DNA_END=870 /DNA_ORIENTATION=-
MSQVPSVTARTTTASASSWETAKRLFSLFVDRRCLAGAAFTQDDECHKALPIYVATASLALLVILFVSAAVAAVTETAAGEPLRVGCGRRW